jgi:membrane-bound lytic murein transglycosylase D
VVAEDTLVSVARTYHVATAELAAANQLDEKDSIEGVEALVVPVPPTATPSAHMVLYTVRKGDTLVTIADRFGVSLSQLRRWNKMAGIKVEPGRRLHVAESANLSRSTHGRRRGASAASAGTHAAAKTKGSIAKPAVASTQKAKGTPSAKKSRKPKTSTHAR